MLSFRFIHLQLRLNWHVHLWLVSELRLLSSWCQYRFFNSNMTPPYAQYCINSVTIMCPKDSGNSDLRLNFNIVALVFCILLLSRKPTVDGYLLIHEIPSGLHLWHCGAGLSPIEKGLMSASADKQAGSCECCVNP